MSRYKYNPAYDPGEGKRTAELISCPVGITSKGLKKALKRARKGLARCGIREPFDAEIRIWLVFEKED
jgi:hypothetical protein